MDLSEVVAAAAGLRITEHVGDQHVQVTGITHDSRAVHPGWIFCAVVGGAADGHRFAAEAVRGGAAALLVQRRLDLPVAQLVVQDSRAAMGLLAAAVYGHPSRDMTLVAVTGTNGKTTTCHLLASIFEAAGLRSGVIGTLTGTRTTPEAPELQAALAAMRDDGVKAVALEATSIGLELHRLDGTHVDVAVFTNLSRDHLDVHTTMERYFAAKARLFEPSISERGVVNGDDPYGRLLSDAAQIPTVTFSGADASELVTNRESSRFVWRGVPVVLPLPGSFNVINAVAAATAGAELGLAPDVIAAGLSAVQPVAGRMELVDAGQEFTVLVDYAHTPDGLAAALGSVRATTTGRVIVVFGCGGERDQSKRPLMGQVASGATDIVVITSDNPRSEDPGAIIGQVMSGIPSKPRAVVLSELDRRSAIQSTLAMARAGDTVVLAGKGHETTQTVGASELAFDDRVVAREVLSELTS